ncbi:MAG: hypothetical protein E6G56_14870 [Actinobacteria bacterium]|nr:MAG: hypothetical protein E6G56_14870 [Actinomycetota bacterium]
MLELGPDPDAVEPEPFAPESEPEELEPALDEPALGLESEPDVVELGSRLGVVAVGVERTLAPAVGRRGRVDLPGNAWAAT